MKRAEPVRNEHLGRAKSLRRGHERGVALLLTIFGLLLLTAIAAAMLFSSNSETLISVNYRDEQAATYAALSALQEARDRIQPATGDLALNGYVPTQLPGTTNGQVLYLINPASGETATGIAPWNWNSGGNPYFDKELCQENTMGLTPNAPGVACQGQSSVPSNTCSHIGAAGGGWCFYYDNSSDNTSASNNLAWTQATPMSYKWVRIALKADNNTPVYVPTSSAGASGKQVCWDGNYQSEAPSNYTSNCLPTSGNVVTGLNLTASGMGYATPPTVTISGGGGSGATATAILGPSSVGSISAATVGAAGTGYTTPPTVTIATPDGTGATFQAVINGSPVTGVTVSNSGSNYCYPTGITPTVNFSTTPSSNTITNASATVTMVANGCIAAVTQTPAGSCSGAASKSYPIGSSGPPGGGSGFSGTVNYGAGGTVTSITINSVGSAYSTGPSTVTTKGSCTITPTFTTGYQISSITVSSGGSYMAQPNVTLGGGSASAPSIPTYATLTSQWTAVPSPITAISVLTGGSGYLQLSYTLNITGGGGSGATATASTTTTNGVTGFTLTSGGGGYTSAPTVTLSGGGCSTSCATATASIGAGSVNTAMGPVFLLTSLAATKTGARAMAQMEVGVRPPFSLNLGGALTLAGPGATFGTPNSAVFGIEGNDSCGKAATKPAIGVYDNASQTNVINSLGKPSDYTGAGGTPSVENTYSMLGGSSLTPANLDADLVDLQSQPAATVITGPATSLPGTTTSSLTVVDGNLTLSGDPNGSGILVVTGTLTLQGNFTWNGIVLVIGAGSVQNNGGGNGSITGAMYVANIFSSTTTSYNPATATLSSSVGAPTFNWNGGGGNGIQYDSCQADALLKKYTSQPNQKPLQILSTRLLEF